MANEEAMDYNNKVQRAITALRSHVKAYDSKIPPNSSEINELCQKLMLVPENLRGEFSGLVKTVIIHYGAVAGLDSYGNVLERGIESMNDREKFMLNVQITKRTEEMLRVERLRELYKIAPDKKSAEGK